MFSYADEKGVLHVDTASRSEVESNTEGLKHAFFLMATRGRRLWW